MQNLNRLRVYLTALCNQAADAAWRGKNKILQLRHYKFFRCAGCKSKLRVARGKGKIQVTCPRCGLRFRKRS